jgi:predicted phosphoribosyltransferase
VGLEDARALGAPLDLLIVRKVGVPSQPELAMGAIASGNVRVLNRLVLDQSGIDARTFDEVAARELEELERREVAYRGDRPRPSLEGRTVVLVDDGIATGSTVRAAIQAVRASKPARVVVAVPVASPDVVRALGREADEVVCPLQPLDMYAIGAWYMDFPQLDDDEVRDMLDEAWAEETG